MRRGVAGVIVCAVLAACASDPGSPARPAQYRLVEEAEHSAKPVALQILRHLAAGELEQAAQLSNAPQRRYEVLNEFRARVGEQEFRRLYGQYLAPGNRVVAELALGPRHLLVWKLGSHGDRVVGQYYVLLDGRFLMDDAPGPERAALARALAQYRSSYPFEGER